MYQTNEILLVNFNPSLMNEVLSNFLQVINSSNLPDFEKNYEMDLANRVFGSGAMNLDVLRPEIQNTKFYPLYGFLAGRTDIPIIETPLQTNLRILQEGAGGLSSILGGVGNVVGSVLGSSTTCGLIGGLFGTKKCREKQQAQQNLVNAQTAFQSQALTQPATQNLVIPRETQATPPPPDSNNPMEMIKKYWWVIAAVLLYFLFFKKKGRK